TRGVEQPAHAFAAFVVKIGGVLRQPVHTTVDVGVGLAVVQAFRFDHDFGLLRGGGVVQIHQRLVAYPPRQDGKVLHAAQTSGTTGGEGQYAHDVSSSSNCPSGRRA